MSEVPTVIWLKASPKVETRQDRSLAVLAGHGDRLSQHVEIADVIGQNQHQPRVERRGRLFRQAAPGIDQRDISGIRIGKLRCCDECASSNFRHFDRLGLLTKLARLQHAVNAVPDSCKEPIALC